MPIDASIAMGVRPAQIDNQTNMLAQVLGVQNLQRQNQLGQFQLQQAQNDNDETNRLRAALSAPGFDRSAPGAANQILSIAPIKGQGIVKAWQDADKSKAEISKTQADAAKSQFEVAHQKSQALLDAVSSAVDQPSYDAAVKTAASLGADVSQVPAAYDPKVVSQFGQAALTAKERLENKMKEMGFDVQRRGQDMTQQTALTTTGMNNATSIKTTGMNNATSTANTAATQAGENARTNQKNAVQLQMAGIGPNGTDPGSAGLSPAAVENAASRYNLDGTLPPLAMGASSGAVRKAILNRAAELSMGTTGTDQRINQMDVKSASAALSQLTKAKTMNAAFEDTANQNANLALGLSKQMDRTGIPLINAGIQAWKTGTGSPEATQFAAANETFVNEYAKIMSGGMGNTPSSDSARAHAHDLLTTKMTPEQYEGNVRLLQKEMQNRMAGFETQEKAIRARMGGGAAPAASPVAVGHPSDIADLLNKYGK